MGADREYNEKNLRYETAIVLPGSTFASFSDGGSKVTYKGVDVWVFRTDEEAKDWMDELFKGYLWHNKDKLIHVCKTIGGPKFRYSRYVDWESLADHLVKHYNDSSVVTQTFRGRFRNDAEGKRYIHDDVIGAVGMLTNAEYRLSNLVFDFVDMDALVSDLESHLGMRVFKQGSFYYVIDLYPSTMK